MYGSDARTYDEALATVDHLFSLYLPTRLNKSKIIILGTVLAIYLPDKNYNRSCDLRTNERNNKYLYGRVYRRLE